MDSKMLKKLSYGFLGVAAVFIVGCGGKGEDNRTMAVVNGDVITKEQYYAHMERKPSILIQTNQGPVSANVAQPMNFQALNDIVNQKLLVQMAKDENLYPTDQEVQREIEFQQSKNEGFVKTLTSEGLTLTQIKEQLRLDLCRFKLITKGIVISDATVEDYIKKNPNMFMNPKTVDLSWIVVKDQKTAASVDSELKAGQTFAVVAKQFSSQRDPMYPSRIYSQFPPRLKQIVDKLQEGGTSEWLVDGGQRVKFHVEKKTEASKIEVKAWMKDEIRRQLMLQKGSVAVDLDKRLLNKRKAAKIEISQPGLKSRFEQVQKTLKESDVATGSKKETENPSAPK
jgi:foldase protein PrsA